MFFPHLHCLTNDSMSLVYHICCYWLCCFIVMLLRRWHEPVEGIWRQGSERKSAQENIGWEKHASGISLFSFYPSSFTCLFIVSLHEHTSTALHCSITIFSHPAYQSTSDWFISLYFCRFPTLKEWSGCRCLCLPPRTSSASNQTLRACSSQRCIPAWSSSSSPTTTTIMVITTALMLVITALFIRWPWSWHCLFFIFCSFRVHVDVHFDLVMMAGNVAGVPSTTTTAAETVKIMFKSGDDLRQDQLIMQLMYLMDGLLKKVHDQSLPQS